LALGVEIGLIVGAGWGIVDWIEKPYAIQALPSEMGVKGPTSNGSAVQSKG
jgi:hypothetical protein